MGQGNYTTCSDFHLPRRVDKGEIENQIHVSEAASLRVFFLFMEYWKTIILRFMNKTPLFYCIFIFFFSVCALLGTTNTKLPCLDIRCPLTGKADFSFQEFKKALEKMKIDEEPIVSHGKREEISLSLARTKRFLSGPGSSPPRCTSKCGRCTPCKPVHVPVPPGTPVTAEYYPEAWRCKCGNKLYMP